VTVKEAIPFVGAFESTYQPDFDVDVAETTGHTLRWRKDLDLLMSCGVDQIRYPVRWHRVERAPGQFDWRETDEVLGHIRERGLRVIVDLLHHTSHPAWLDFADPRFGAALLRYVDAFARRYGWIEGYTLFNEPFTTFLLCGQEGIWPPRLRGLDGFLEIASNVMPALAEASRLCCDLLPAALHVHVEVCERATADTPEAEEFVDLVNDRRFFLTDVLVGRSLPRDRPFVKTVVEAGHAGLLEIEPGNVDVLGLDYYAHNQWHWTSPETGTTASPNPAHLSELLVEYWERYGITPIVGETNIRGYPSDRASWLKYTVEQCELAAKAGVPVAGYCWFPFVDSCDWDSILCRSDSKIDPVGVYWLDERFERRASSMSRSYAAAARGAAAAALPAYEFQPPVSKWLAGWMPHLSHWDWEPAPELELQSLQIPDSYEIELKVAAECLS
jgi:beta-glucosidase/6-phospho-beta-glucosidase/beta-galactosidase